jgi:hypothetical protein
MNSIAGKSMIRLNITAARLPHLFALCAFACMAPAAHGQSVVDVQYQRKAEMLCPLGSILVPAETLAADEAFRIGILGGDPFQGTDPAGNPVNFLDEMATQKGAVRGKRIIITRFATAKECQPCHVLFISAAALGEGPQQTAQERLAAVLKKLPAKPLLVAGDSPGLAEAGAAINWRHGR